MYIYIGTKSKINLICLFNWQTGYQSIASYELIRQILPEYHGLELICKSKLYQSIIDYELMCKIIPEYRGLGPLTARSGCVHLEDHQTGQSLVYPPVNSQHDLIRNLTLTHIQSYWIQIYIKNLRLGFNLP